jgi:hypothetical protein
MIFLFCSNVGRRPTRFFCVCGPPAPLSELVRCFSSCSMDFSQQIAQVVLFLFLSRPCVLMWTGDCALYSRGCACTKIRAGAYAVGRKIGLERVIYIITLVSSCFSYTYSKILKTWLFLPFTDFSKHLVSLGIQRKLFWATMRQIILTTYLPTFFIAMHKMSFFPNICEFNLISNILQYEAHITSFPHMSYRLKPRTI